ETLLQRATAAFPDVRVVPNTQMRGLSGARNTALDAARFPLLAYLDDDAVAAKDWLASLCVHFVDPLMVAAGSAVEPNWEAARPRWFPPEFDWVVGCSYQGLPLTLAPVRNPLGGAMVVRRENVLAVGSFRTDLGRVGTLPVGCEETELCLRLVQRFENARIVYDPTSSVHHFVPRHRARWSYYLKRCYGEGVSKAAVARVSPRTSALRTERAYLSRVIPAAFANDVLHARPLRATALVAGITLGALGYARGLAARMLRPVALDPLRTR
ncbi:MAG TPA: glycosyltransferase, partial [Acidimicrobiales bacterium]|nr:glycosyltransferase [Acidimicrobiales bacterium]